MLLPLLLNLPSSCDELFEPPVEGKSGDRRFQTNLLTARPHASFERLLETNIVLRIIRKTRIAAFACNHACMPVGSADNAMSLSLLGEIFLQPRPSERELQQTSLLSRKPQVMIRRPLC